MEPQRNLAYDEEKKSGNETVDCLIITEEYVDMMIEEEEEEINE